jgi:glycerol-3-phosphate acyltransferase PlsY
VLWVSLIAIAFLAGSIPFGLIIARAKGIDIRQHGSRNIGATNVWRVLGWRAGLTCFLLDVLKGFAPTLGAGIAAGVVRGHVLNPPIAARDASLWLAVMFATILGHMFSPWVGFKGGKGVATGLGSALAVFPYLTIPALAAFAIWLLVFRITRYVSLASIVAAAAMPCATLGWALFSAARDRGVSVLSSWPFIGVASLLAVFIIWAHRANIARLRAGTEKRFGSPPPARQA